MNILLKYVQKTYMVKSFRNEKISDNEPIFKQIRQDEEFLNLFCFIIQKRLVVIDDLEFTGK